MTKQFLLLLTLLPLIGFGQTTTLSSADVDSDGCVTVSDVLGVLQFYGQCSADTTLNKTWYWFHGLDSNWLSAGSSYYLTNAPQFGMFTNGENLIVTESLSEAMQHYFDNQSAITGGREILTTEFAGPIAGTSQQFVFNALTSGTGDYYVLVPDNTSFPEDLTTAGIMQFPAPSCAINAPQKANVVLDGEDYVLYLMPGSSDGGSRTLAFY